MTRHIPVLINEAMRELNLVENSLYIDCTLGAGGYTSYILSNTSSSKVVSFDIDPDVSKIADEIYNQYKERFVFINKNFTSIEEELSKLGIKKIAGLIADIGVSSMQIDEEERGFSFSKDGPLDMRMSKQGMSASDVVNKYSYEDLAEIIYKYGNEIQSRKIARAIVKARSEKPIESTKELSDLIKKTIPYFGSKIDVSTKTFQALRIFINKELSNLEKLLIDGSNLLEIGGVLGIVSFHSLEDRIVKSHIIKNCPKKVQVSKYSKDKTEDENFCFDRKTHKLITPTEEEIKSNPRSRSAKLRVVTKIKNVQVT